jgi:hypothetical protein
MLAFRAPDPHSPPQSADLDVFGDRSSRFDLVWPDPPEFIARIMGPLSRGEQFEPLCWWQWADVPEQPDTHKGGPSFGPRSGGSGGGGQITCTRRPSSAQSPRFRPPEQLLLDS